MSPVTVPGCPKKKKLCGDVRTYTPTQAHTAHVQSAQTRKTKQLPQLLCAHRKHKNGAHAVTSANCAWHKHLIAPIPFIRRDNASASTCTRAKGHLMPAPQHT
uniref:Uncharacterized protein n=1 Tax=Trypanosoma vivax (strain Y486) TaxID=1055687 RepID=G0U216_TRYVY|nr:hypothetical protein, unlikely [Trypanosoma vivax Y486]